MMIKQKLLDAYAKICEKAYMSHPRTNFESESFAKILDKCQKDWSAQYIDELESTVLEHLQKADEALLFSYFQHFARHGDFIMPIQILSALDDSGDEAVNRLSDTAFDMLSRKNTSEMYESIHAMKALGRLKKEAFVPRMIEYAMELPESEELLIESVIDGLKYMGEICIEPLIICIDDEDKINNNAEYMLQTLSQIGSKYKNTRVFECLKKTFLRMGNKDMGALCLAEYGDMRGIAVLTTFLQHHKEEVSREVFFEILYCIKALGGQVEEL